MTQTKLRRAVTYVRVSTSPQEMTASRETQTSRNEAYALREGLTIVRPFYDVGSGLSITERPGFLLAVDFVCDPANGITDILCDDLSRLTRSPRDYFPYMDRMEKAGVTLHSVMEGEKVGPDSDFTWGMICLTHERNSRLTGIKTKNNQRAAVERGRVIATKPGYGYMREEFEKEIQTSQGTKVIKETRWVRNPDEWPYLLMIINLSLNGKSPMTIARELNLQRVPGPVGQEWSDRTIRYILRNPHYLGKSYRGRISDSKLPGRHEITPVTYSREETHEAAMTREQFDLIEQMIVARTRTSGPTKCHSSVNILSGMAKCGFCKMAGKDSNLIITRDEPGGTARLRCARKKDQGAAVCPSKPILMDDLVKQVLERLLETNLTEEDIRQLIEDVAQDSHEYLTEGEARKKELSKELSEVRKRERNLSEVMQTKGTRAKCLATLMQDLEGLEEKERTLQEGIQEINEATEEARLFINDPEGILEAVLDLRTYTETRDLEASKELINLFIVAVYVYNEKLPEDADHENHMEMHWTLPIFSEATGESSDREIVILKKEDYEDDYNKFCLLGTSMGIDRGYRLNRLRLDGFPRPRGDRPVNQDTGEIAEAVPPPTRG